MLQVNNPTPFKASTMLLPDRHGVDTVVTVVKGTFEVGDSLGLAPEQVALTLADEYHGEPGASSIRVPSDVSIEKVGTDVVVLGTAWAPDDQPTWQMDVSMAVGPLAKTVRVFGDRVWDVTGGASRVSWVAPFTRIPLVWERAFGGSDVTDKGPTAEPRNPVGMGFRVPNGTKPIAGMALPNIEDPNALIGSWSDAPAPAGFAPVAPHWLPRRSFAGTYDEAWQNNRSPYLPLDFDPRFCQIAPVGLVATRHLEGGEPVTLSGMTLAGVLRFTLPALRVGMAHWLDTGVEERPGLLDTIIIEPDARRLVMVWRAILPCDKKTLKVREIEIAVESSGVPEVAAA
jgi:hypothetical protein